MRITGGDKLEKRLAELAAKIAKPASLDVGFLENATYPDGTSVPAVAAFNEFGTATAPPRPFFRGMVHEKSPGWGDAVAANLTRDGFDAAVALGHVGEGIKGQLQQAIVDFSGVPLAPATIAKKGNDKQLVDTGHMLNSVDYRVRQEKTP